MGNLPNRLTERHEHVELQPDEGAVPASDQSSDLTVLVQLFLDVTELVHEQDAHKLPLAFDQFNIEMRKTLDRMMHVADSSGEENLATRDAIRLCVKKMKKSMKQLSGLVEEVIAKQRDAAASHAVASKEHA